MHPRQAELVKAASEVTDKLAAKVADKAPGPAVLWKYVDPEGNEFYLKVKKMTIRSPFSGKVFTTKPTRENLGAIGKELRMKDEPKEAPAGGAGPGGKTTMKKRKASEWKA